MTVTKNRVLMTKISLWAIVLGVIAFQQYVIYQQDTLLSLEKKQRMLEAQLAMFDAKEAQISAERAVKHALLHNK